MKMNINNTFPFFSTPNNHQVRNRIGDKGRKGQQEEVRGPKKFLMQYRVLLTFLIEKIKS